MTAVTLSWSSCICRCVELESKLASKSQILHAVLEQLDARDDSIQVMRGATRHRMAACGIEVQILQASCARYEEQLQMVTQAHQGLQERIPMLQAQAALVPELAQVCFNKSSRDHLWCLIVPLHVLLRASHTSPPPQNL